MRSLKLIIICFYIFSKNLFACDYQSALETYLTLSQNYNKFIFQKEAEEEAMKIAHNLEQQNFNGLDFKIARYLKMIKSPNYENFVRMFQGLYYKNLITNYMDLNETNFANKYNFAFMFKNHITCDNLNEINNLIQKTSKSITDYIAINGKQLDANYDSFTYFHEGYKLATGNSNLKKPYFDHLDLSYLISYSNTINGKNYTKILIMIENRSIFQKYFKHFEELAVKEAIGSNVRGIISFPQ